MKRVDQILEAMSGGGRLNRGKCPKMILTGWTDIGAQQGEGVESRVGNEMSQKESNAGLGGGGAEAQSYCRFGNDEEKGNVTLAKKGATRVRERSFGG